MSSQRFPNEAARFLADLEQHNNRTWFEEHKTRYRDSVEAPARAFFEEMKQRLAELCGVPFTGKIFRIYRDVRFSKDKTPYNPHVRMLFSCNTDYRKRDGRHGRCCGAHPAFYFSLEPRTTIVGTGNFEFSKDTLNAYRDAVTSNIEGAVLDKVLAGYTAAKGFRIDPPELKRVPNGYPKDHPRETLLRRKGLAVCHESLIDEKTTTSLYLNSLVSQYTAMKPLYDWLAAL